MLIQSTSSAAPATRFTSDSMPVAASAPKTESAPVELHPSAKPQSAAQQNAPAPTPAQVQNAVDKLNNAMQKIDSNVEFSIDTDTKQTVIKVVESKTGDVIRQFPSKDILAISREIDRVRQGLLIKQEA